MSENENWPTVTIKSWDDLEFEISNKDYRDWVYRGHSDLKWELESSLFRLFNDISSILPKSRKFAKNKHEIELIRVFKSQAHLFLNYLPPKNKSLEWLSLMQHYGTPTRLLDMTFSPYVAAYFALHEGHEDCCIYALKHSYFKEIDLEHFGTTNYKDKLLKKDQRGVKSFFIPYEPEMKNERIVSQQGVFLIASTNYETYGEIISNYEFDKKSGVKYILKKDIRFEGLKKLRLMNISAATLFPGIEGFCKSLKFQVIDNISKLSRLQ